MFISAGTVNAINDSDKIVEIGYQINNSGTEFPDYIEMDWHVSLVGKVLMPSIEDSEFTSSSVRTVESFTTTPTVGTTVWDWYLYSISGDPEMTLRAVSGNVEIWVQDNLEFPEGDPRIEDPYNLMITDKMVQHLANELNNVIYPIDTENFEVPFNRNGADTIFEQSGCSSYTWEWISTDNPQRVIIKVVNIRDENYYDPDYPYYIAGFYNPIYSNYYNRNMIHIDAWRWWQRLGSKGTQWFTQRPDLTVTRPYLYESTTSHEYQHNIHNDWNPDSPLFMNEGCSMNAEVLCGYGISWSTINSYLYTPDNSLTEWGDQGGINILADYGAAALWTAYLSDHYSGSLSRYVQAGIPGIEGINTALEELGYSEKFGNVYYDWSIANLIHKDEPGEGKYNYISIDLQGTEAIPASTLSISHSWTSETDFGNTITILGYDTGVAKLEAYGSDYIITKSPDEPGHFFFDGDDVAILGWHLVEKDNRLVWYSDSIDLGDFLLSTTIDIPDENAVLIFETKYFIEDGWDFGFVQISTNGGSTWTSIANEYTTLEYYPDAHPDIVANLPGLTGISDEWITMSFDLTDYAGQEVMLGFRYMTDWALSKEGWYVDNITINSKTIQNEEFKLNYPEADYFVTLLGINKATGSKGLHLEDSKELKIEAEDTVTYLGIVPNDDITEIGTYDIGFTQEFDYLALIVSSDNGPVDFIFRFDYSID